MAQPDAPCAVIRSGVITICDSNISSSSSRRLFELGGIETFANPGPCAFKAEHSASRAPNDPFDRRISALLSLSLSLAKITPSGIGAAPTPIGPMLATNPCDPARTEKKDVDASARNADARFWTVWTVCTVRRGSGRVSEDNGEFGV